MHVRYYMYIYNIQCEFNVQCTCILYMYIEFTAHNDFVIVYSHEHKEQLTIYYQNPKRSKGH